MIFNPNSKRGGTKSKAEAFKFIFSRRQASFHFKSWNKKSFIQLGTQQIKWKKKITIQKYIYIVILMNLYYKPMSRVSKYTNDKRIIIIRWWLIIKKKHLNYQQFSMLPFYYHVLVIDMHKLLNVPGQLQLLYFFISFISNFQWLFFVMTNQLNS